MSVSAVLIFATGCGATNSASNGTAPSGDSTRPSLGSLYYTLIKACTADPAQCGHANLGLSSDVAIKTASNTFCTRLESDVSGFLTAAGISQPVSENRADIDTDNTVQGGWITPSKSDDAGCINPDSPNGFSMFLAPAPPATLSTPATYRQLPFGKQCIAANSDQFSGTSVDLACLAPDGWGFDIAEGNTSVMNDDVLQQTYQKIADDLGAPPTA